MVLVVRFVAGLRFLAGPLAGPLLFVPYAVGLGYAVGSGLGPSIERFGRRAESLGFLAAAGLTLGVLGLRVTQVCLARVHPAGEAPAR